MPVAESSFKLHAGCGPERPSRVVYGAPQNFRLKRLPCMVLQSVSDGETACPDPGATPIDLDTFPLTEEDRKELDRYRQLRDDGLRRVYPPEIAERTITLLNLGDDIRRLNSVVKKIGRGGH